MYVDLGAERQAIAAEKCDQRIAVEVQSFLSRSPVRDLQEAVGQYGVYRAVLAKTEPDRKLYLAAPQPVYEAFLGEAFGRLIIDQLQLRVLIFDDLQERVVQWIN